MVRQLTSTPRNTRAGKAPLDVIKLFKMTRLMWDQTRRTTLIYWVAQGIEKRKESIRIVGLNKALM